MLLLIDNMRDYENLIYYLIENDADEDEPVNMEDKTIYTLTKCSN
jgi:hypothetical protein